MNFIESTTSLDYALDCADSGIPVFPCLPNKAPAVPGGFTAASINPALIGEWFADPDRLVGVPTGGGNASGYDVLDIDARSGGLEWLAANEHRLPATPRYRTLSGGWHILFRHREGMRCSADRVARGVDVRADGGYAIDWRAHGHESVNGHLAPADWPEWLAELAMPRPAVAAVPESARGDAPDPADVVNLLDAMPNPESADRDTWTRVNLAARGCMSGDAEGDAAIQEAAIRWSCRWPGCPGEDAEREKWESDWLLRHRRLAGWPNLLYLARTLGAGGVAARLQAEATFTAEPLPEAGEPADPDRWRAGLMVDAKGKPLGNIANVMRALREAPEWRGVLAYDAFANRLLFRRAPPWPGGAPGEVTDADVARTLEWVQHAGIPATAAADAMAAVADDNRFDPLRAYVDGLPAHDGTPRIDTWLADYLGAEDTPLNRAFGAKFLIAMVARALQPGCQVDTMLILEGRQGLRKSSALRALGGEWFTDRMPDLKSKDAPMQIAGRWLVEFAELDTLHRSEAGAIKAFITARVDRLRLPYGKLARDFPRRAVFAGTVNPGGTGYLKDETGGRRFWPVACGVGWAADRQIDAEALAAVRDQLFAEAAARLRAGESWWLPPHLEPAQAEAAADRYDADPWSAAIADYVRGRAVVTTDEVMAECLRLPTKERDRRTEMRVGGALRAMGWAKERRIVGGRQRRVFVAPENAETVRPGNVVPFDRARELSDLMG